MSFSLKIMKLINMLFSSCVVLVLVCCVVAVASAQAAPKNVLVVTTTTSTSFRHSSIPTAEKVLGQLAKESGVFTVDYARVEPGDPQFKTADGKLDKAKFDAAVKQVLAEKMSPAALANYDAVVFANTTGDLPLPDPQAFLDWIKSGKGFVGMHSASDTFHHFQPFIEMLGGEFKTHDKDQVQVEAINQDQDCPACRHLGATWKVFDEIYLFKNFERTNVHGLLGLDKHPNNKTPGDYPISWCKEYGKGRVFYTSLGHREDVWDANTPPGFERKNPKEVALAYQQHILNGIKWAIGLEQWDAKPQKKSHIE